MTSNFHFSTAIDEETCDALKKCYEDLYILVAWGYKNHTLFVEFLLIKMIINEKISLSVLNSPYKYPALVGIVAVKKKKLYFWIVNCNNLIIRSNIT